MFEGVVGNNESTQEIARPWAKKEKRNMFRLFAAILIIVSIVGCSSTNRLLSSLRYKNDVIKLQTDERILFEKGAEKEAKLISSILDSSIDVVTRFYGSPFTKDIYITVSASQKHFMRRCGGSPKARGMFNWGRIFISPLAFTRDTYEKILVHELAHLHTGEKTGVFHYVSDIPAWFSEGLSVYVSDGGGAESVSDSQAIDWIIEGKHFNPTAKGSLFKPSGYVSTLPWPMFYRQAGLFVKYLSDFDGVLAAAAFYLSFSS